MIEHTQLLLLDEDIVFRVPDPTLLEPCYGFHLRLHAPLDELVERLEQCRADRFIVVSDAGVPAALREQVKACIARVAPCSEHLLRGGERDKRLATVERIGEEAIEAGATHASVVIGLGGGLVGNVAGLLAGLLYRGVRLIHMPTTFLAVSDSVLSLKQGVNSRFGKNHFGLFWRPEWIWSDLAWFASLPREEIQAALCELIKNVLVICPEYYDEVRTLLRQDATYTPEQFIRFIALCIEAKCRVMANDAHEQHGALVLEYGHTVGHALELAAAGALPHGIAVGIGMMVEAEIAHRLSLLPPSVVQAHYELLHANGTPTAIPSFLETSRILELMKKDNKRGYASSSRSRPFEMVLLRALGQMHSTRETVLTPVDQKTVLAALEACHAA